MRNEPKVIVIKYLNTEQTRL